MTTPHDQRSIEDFVPFFKAFCNGTRRRSSSSCSPESAASAR